MERRGLAIGRRYCMLCANENRLGIRPKTHWWNQPVCHIDTAHAASHAGSEFFSE